MLGGPAFATAVRGYDRLQVDNYVAWAEDELRLAQRVTAELVDRLAVSEAAAHRARQLVAASPRDRTLELLTDRVAGMLRLAAQEAAASAQATATDAARAQDVLTHAQEEAEVVVRRARRLEAQAAARLEEAERRCSESRAVEERTRDRVQAMLKDATEEQERLEAAAAARLAQAQRQLEELQSRGHRARQLLRQLTGQVDAAIAALADEAPAPYAFRGNRAGPSQAAPPPVPVPGPDRTVPLGRRHRLWRSA
jgi:cell division septum initiation protein DivIVA